MESFPSIKKTTYHHLTPPPHPPPKKKKRQKNNNKKWPNKSSKNRNSNSNCELPYLDLVFSHLCPLFQIFNICKLCCEFIHSSVEENKVLPISTPDIYYDKIILHSLDESISFFNPRTAMNLDNTILVNHSPVQKLHAHPTPVSYTHLRAHET